MSVDLTTCVVRILDHEGATVGSGFVATESGLVVTCAHVVDDAQFQPGDRINVVLHTTGDQRQALVEKEWWRDRTAEDVAVLRLLGPLPQEVTPLPLGHLCLDSSTLTLKAFGFPAAKPVEGEYASCTIVGQTTENGYPVLQVSSTEATRGFSGAPVFDTAARKTVGIVTSISPLDAYGRQGTTGFAIPSHTIVEICPDLEIPNVQRLVDALTGPQKKHLADHFVDLAARSQNDPRVPRPHSVVEDWGVDDAFKPMEGTSAEISFAWQSIVSDHVTPVSAAMEELSKHHRCLIVGDAGAGKTTVLEKLALSFAMERLQNDKAPVPVFLKLSSWVDESSAFEFICSHWPLASDPHKAIAAEKAAIFLDALNEVGSEPVEKATKLREWINSDQGPKQIRVTSRTEDYVRKGQDLGLPVVISLEPMDELRIKRMVTSYLDSYGIDSKDFLAQVIPSSRQQVGTLHGLAKNPYMLTAMLVWYADPIRNAQMSGRTSTTDLPQNEGSLSRRLISTLWLWEGSRPSEGWVTLDKMEDKFSELAFAMIDDDQSTLVPVDYALQYCKNPELLEAAKRAHIVELVDDKMRFYHQLMQEYFAAVKLKKIGVHTKLRKPKVAYGMRRETKWDQVIVAVCGIVEPSSVDRIISGLLEHDDPYLAAICIASGATVSKETIDRTVHRLLKDIGSRWTMSDQIGLACKALEQIGQPTVQALRDFVADKKIDIELRINAVPSLGRIGDNSVLPTLYKYREELERDHEKLTRPRVDVAETALNIGAYAAKAAVVIGVDLAISKLLRARTPPWVADALTTDGLVARKMSEAVGGDEAPLVARRDSLLPIVDQAIADIESSQRLEGNRATAQGRHSERDLQTQVSHEPWPKITIIKQDSVREGGAKSAG